MDMIWQQSGPLAVTLLMTAIYLSLSLLPLCVYGMHANAFRDKQQHMKSITASPSPLVIHNISTISRSQRA